MDEFLVSGETIVRNLEIGIRRATELGRVMHVGYLPDMFGHIAQMPQILPGRGSIDAVVWRGVPAAIDRHAFGWRSPGRLGRPDRVPVGRLRQRSRPVRRPRPDRCPSSGPTSTASRRCSATTDILAMYGEDHSIPLQGYADLVDEFNASRTDLRIEVATLDDYLAATA